MAKDRPKFDVRLKEFSPPIAITKPLIVSCKMSDVPPLRGNGSESDKSEDDSESNGSGRHSITFATMCWNSGVVAMSMRYLALLETAKNFRVHCAPSGAPGAVSRLMRHGPRNGSVASENPVVLFGASLFQFFFVVRPETLRIVGRFVCAVSL